MFKKVFPLRISTLLKKLSFNESVFSPLLIHDVVIHRYKILTISLKNEPTDNSLLVHGIAFVDTLNYKIKYICICRPLIRDRKPTKHL